MQATSLKSWKALKRHVSKMKQFSLNKAFNEKGSRAEKFSLKAPGNILIDYSKNLISEKTMSLLFQLASESKLQDNIKAMFEGKLINFTEKRAALHIALRSNVNRKIICHGKNVMTDVELVIEKMKTFTSSIREGEWRGFSGKPITDIVNIGIGGSDLGPKMVCQALKPYGKILNVHFVSNVDGFHIGETLNHLNQETTLFIISSKTFTTQETMSNANEAKRWIRLKSKNENDIKKHFVAVSTNLEAVLAFGIPAENMFEFWDWVGGRYSLWSAIGLVIALYIGMDNFQELLEGASEMDNHFRKAPLNSNAPVILALLGIWYNNFFKTETYAVLPYGQNLLYFPEYLQQLDMESNGKRVLKSGNVANYSTGPILWGQVGTNGQHAFFQLLHQGTKLVPIDFLVASEGYGPLAHHHDMLVANCFAQSEALMKGKTLKEVNNELSKQGYKPKKIKKLAPHKVFEGNKPSTTIIFPKLTPSTLGALLALYEHKVFVQGVIWKINSFDQWGVELGKSLAKQILNDFSLKKDAGSKHDESTLRLINYYRERRSSKDM